MKSGSWSSFQSALPVEARAGGEPDDDSGIADAELAWVVDECQDANGFWTIRLADGTENGNTDAQPIATVFDLAIAEHIVATHNLMLGF